MRVGVVGCGAISDIYLTNMIHNFENLEVAACCAGHLEHAKKKAEQYGIKGCTYEEILADPSIEMVVILTPAPTHEGLIRQALEAGKHVQLGLQHRAVAHEADADVPVLVVEAFDEVFAEEGSLLSCGCC